jgi:hypothetical protein
MNIPKMIYVNNGVSTEAYETTADTIGELFTASFREDFNISSTGKPTLNRVAVGDDAELTPNCTVGYINSASSKS